MEHDFDPADPKGHEERNEMQSIRDLYKIPLACPACNTLLYNWDNQFFYRHGICADCTILYVDDRDLPEDLKADRKKLLAYVKEKIAEKK